MKNILHKELSYEVTGLCFQVHRELGRYSNERQYGDRFEELLIKKGISYKREFRTDDLQKGNQIDFLIDDKIVVEFKAKKFITKDDYYQVQRYLHALGFELGIIYNFRDSHLKPKRILNPDNKGFSQLTPDEIALVKSLDIGETKYRAK